MKPLKLLSDAELIHKLEEVELSLLFQTTISEKKFILPLVKRFISKMEQFKNQTEYDEYEELINLAEPLSFNRLQQYKKKWSFLYESSAESINRNFPSVNKNNFLVIRNDGK